MAESSLTLRRAFSLPGDGGEGPSSSGWKTLEEKINKNLKGIKWVAMPDLVAKTCELFDVEIPSLWLATWKKARELQIVLDESRKAPEEVRYLELAEHTMSGEHHPYIEVRIKNKTIKKFEFTIRVLFKLKSFILKIQEGVIKEIQTGSCEFEGRVEYEDLTVCEKRLEPIALQGSITLI
jgi:hypothetical protein